MSAEPITTDELLDDGEARTGLLRAQLVRMVGKSAAIRHVASHPKYADRFVLKGGSLLTHVYDSPRQSIADADYVHLEPDVVKAPQLDDAFSFREGHFTMAATFRPEIDARTDDVNRFRGDVIFDIQGIELIPQRRRRSRDAPHTLKITVSIRPGERLDSCDEELIYKDALLSEPSHFSVQGLTRNELAAEKVLGWCSKDLAKHFTDLAYLKREHGGFLDYERIAFLIRKKFEHERRDRRYALRGITTVGGLGGAFTDKERIRDFIHGDWARLATDEIFFLPHELGRIADERLSDSANVEAFALAFWTDLGPYLRDAPKPTRRRRSS
jgi:Nucleotidyl transferase AbiEii toxin, Type IV TA system